MEPPPHAHRTPRDGKKQQRRKKNQGEAPTRAHLPGGRDCAASSHAVPTANRTSPARPNVQRAREGAGGGAHKRAARRRGPSGQIARSRLPSDPGRRDALSPNEPANRRGRRLARWETARHFRAAGGQRDEEGGIKRARCPSAAAPEPPRHRPARRADVPVAIRPSVSACPPRPPSVSSATHTPHVARRPPPRAPTTYECLALVHEDADLSVVYEDHVALLV